MDLLSRACCFLIHRIIIFLTYELWKKPFTLKSDYDNFFNILYQRVKYIILTFQMIAQITFREVFDHNSRKVNVKVFSLNTLWTLVGNSYHWLILFRDLVNTSFKVCKKFVLAKLIINTKTCQKGSDMDDHYAVCLFFASFFILESILFLIPSSALQKCSW